jgi:hypothetical protein
MNGSRRAAAYGQAGPLFTSSRDHCWSRAEPKAVPGCDPPQDHRFKGRWAVAPRLSPRQLPLEIKFISSSRLFGRVGAARSVRYAGSSF